MFQTVGHNVLDAYAECMGVPLFRGEIRGSALQQSLQYERKEEGKREEADEVESLYWLLRRVKEAIPSVQAVSSGAILSDYQRYRVENVCARLGLVSLAYLWRRDQETLLQEMIAQPIDAILIKVAAMGLHPDKHLGKSITALYPYLCKLKNMYGCNVCGEGGEYETLTLDCPLFKKKIVIDEMQTIIHSDDAIAPVGYLRITKYHLEEKERNAPLMSSEETQVATAKIEMVSTTEEQEQEENENKEENKKRIESGELDDALLAKFKESHSHFFVAGLQATTDEHSSSVTKQMNQVLSSLQGILLAKDLSMENVVFVSMYLRDIADFAEANAVYKTHFGLYNPPSRLCVQLDLSSKAMIEVIGVRPHSSSTKRNKALHVQSISRWAAACIGPYSQACTINERLAHLAGQIGLDPPTMQLTSSDREDLSLEQRVEGQTKMVLHNIAQVLAAVNSSPDKVLWASCFLTDLQGGKAIVERLWDEWRYSENAEEGEQERNFSFAFLEVGQLPRGAEVEIQVVTQKQKNGDDDDYERGEGKYSLKERKRLAKVDEGRQRRLEFVLSDDRRAALARLYVNDSRHLGERILEMEQQLRKQFAINLTEDSLQLRLYFAQQEEDQLSQQKALMEDLSVLPSSQVTWLPVRRIASMVPSPHATSTWQCLLECSFFYAPF
ncbi:Diphthine--ammonia ligase [Balamuthia mandrillaris]